MGTRGRPALAVTARARAMSSADCTKLRATKSTPAARPNAQVRFVFRGDTRRRERHVWRVDPLVLTQFAAVDHARHNAVAFDRLHSELEMTVIQQETVGRLQGCRERGVRSGNESRSARAKEPMPISRRSPGLMINGTPPSSSPVRIFGPLKSCRIATSFGNGLRRAPNQADGGFVCGRIAVREIQPEHVDARPDQGLDGREIVRSGPERRNDFGVPHTASLQFLSHDH